MLSATIFGLGGIGFAVLVRKSTVGGVKVRLAPPGLMF